MTDDFIIHLRYNYKFNHLIRFELFTQFQQNEILMIQERWLNGTGLRFKLADIENFRAYLGFLGMFEVEKRPQNPTLVWFVVIGGIVIIFLLPLVCQSILSWSARHIINHYSVILMILEFLRIMSWMSRPVNGYLWY